MDDTCKKPNMSMTHILGNNKYSFLSSLHIKEEHSQLFDQIDVYTND